MKSQFESADQLQRVRFSGSTAVKVWLVAACGVLASNAGLTAVQQQQSGNDHAHHEAHHQEHHQHDAAQADSPAPSVDSWTLAEVRKLELDQGRITLRHERIESLDMAPMTMVFRLGEGVSAEGLTEGAKVRFKVKREMGRMVLTALERAP